MNEKQEQIIKTPRGRPRTLTDEERKNHRKESLKKYMNKLKEAYKLTKLKTY